MSVCYGCVIHYPKLIGLKQHFFAISQEPTTQLDSSSGLSSTHTCRLQVGLSSLLPQCQLDTGWTTMTLAGTAGLFSTEFLILRQAGPG